MKLFYGWVIVGAGIVITCLGMGSMMSLGIFLQPMSLATGWSRTSISTAALLNFLCMGPASFLWGALSDRFGTRVVVLSGGALLGPWPRRSEPGRHHRPIPDPVRRDHRCGGRQLLRTADRHRDTLVHPASQPRGSPDLGRFRDRFDDDCAARALADRRLRLAHRNADVGRSLVAVHHPRCVAGA